MAKPYNGHHCWNCWNVALWISNDEPLYRAALACINGPRFNGKLAESPANKQLAARLAARRFLREVVGEAARTPDGAHYTFTAVRAALAGLQE